MAWLEGAMNFFPARDFFDPFLPMRILSAEGVRNEKNSIACLSHFSCTIHILYSKVSIVQFGIGLATLFMR